MSYAICRPWGWPLGPSWWGGVLRSWSSLVEVTLQTHVRGEGSVSLLDL